MRNKIFINIIDRSLAIFNFSINILLCCSNSYKRKKKKNKGGPMKGYKKILSSGGLGLAGLLISSMMDDGKK